MAFRFFLSYARRDLDEYVRRFFQDLVTEVRQLGGGRAQDSGFRDLFNLELGSTWSGELNDALSGSRTFVALCSPNYFASEHCGREWAAFRERLANHNAQTGVTLPALLPIFWVPVSNPPPVLAELQYAREDFGEAYQRDGLHHLARLNKYRDDYLEFIRRLSRLIVDISDRPPLAPGDVDLATTVNAFQGPNPVAAPALPQRAAITSGPSPAARPRPGWRGGPRHVHFIVVAATTRDMADLREDLQQYGLQAVDWSPYRPEMDRRISVFAQSIATGHDFSSGLAEIDVVLQLLEQATEQNELVVLLVDAWATKLDHFREHLNTYDRRNEPWSAVMVPLSSADSETAANEHDLRESLRTAFPRNTARNDELFRVGIETSERFRRDLAEILVKAQSRVFKSGPPTPRSSPGAQPRPALQLPEPPEEQL